MTDDWHSSQRISGPAVYSTKTIRHRSAETKIDPNIDLNSIFAVPTYDRKISHRQLHWRLAASQHQVASAFNQLDLFRPFPIASRVIDSEDNDQDDNLWWWQRWSTVVPLLFLVWINLILKGSKFWCIHSFQIQSGFSTFQGISPWSFQRDWFSIGTALLNCKSDWKKIRDGSPWKHSDSLNSFDLPWAFVRPKIWRSQVKNEVKGSLAW